MSLIILEEIDFLVATLQLETFVFLCALCSFCAFCFVALLRIPNEFDLWHAIRIKLNNSNKWFFFILFYFCYSFVVDIAGWVTFCFLFFTIMCWYDSDSRQIWSCLGSCPCAISMPQYIFSDVSICNREFCVSLFFSAIGASNLEPLPQAPCPAVLHPQVSLLPPLSMASEIRAYYSCLRVAKGCMGLGGVKTGQIVTIKLHM